MHSWPTILRSGNLTLRPIRRRDWATWQQVRQDNAAWLDRWETADPSGRPGERFPAWVRRARRQGARGEMLALVMEIGGDGSAGDTFAGQITAAPITYGAARTATVGYWIAQRHAGQGYTPLAVALVTDYLIGELGIHRVEINIRPENTASLRVVEKLGFAEEGLARGFLYIDGDWRDHRRFVMLAEGLPAGGLENQLLAS